MLLAASEGRHWRYEVSAHDEGYLVRMRAIATGDLDEGFATVFRTMPVAFAYAEMSAAFDRFAGDEDDAPDTASIAEAEASERAFSDLSDRLRDGGGAPAAPTALRAWETRREGAPRAVLH